MDMDVDVDADVDGGMDLSLKCGEGRRRLGFCVGIAVLKRCQDCRSRRVSCTCTVARRDLHGT